MADLSDAAAVYVFNLYPGATSTDGVAAFLRIPSADAQILMTRLTNQRKVFKMPSSGKETNPQYKGSEEFVRLLVQSSTSPLTASTLAHLLQLGVVDVQARLDRLVVLGFLVKQTGGAEPTYTHIP